VLVQFHVLQFLNARSQDVYSLTPYLKNTIAVDEQVARFDVSMKNPGRVEILETYRQKQLVSGHVARMGEKRNAYMILVGRPEGKRPLERPRCRWV
jgi:hypothetical protein